MLRQRSDWLTRSATGVRIPAKAVKKRGNRVTRNLRRRPVLYVILAVMVLLQATSMATGFDLAVKLNYI
ncbi:MAG: hypothetical protein O2788_04135, partial [Chloroflexi bacterium]|nr:hypothetical protein [Chloroflexota bacterium]